MTDKNDPLGDRMKVYENAESDRKLIPLLPVIARLDGRGFSRFTKGLARPYDKRMSDLMIATTEYLVEETNARCGYTQSDEITLGFYEPDYKVELMFGGRIQKLVSTLASLATGFFNQNLSTFIPEKTRKLPTFDCRVFNVPNITEGANAFLWREKDATKNSISMAARHYYSHNQLMNKNGSQMQEMLFQKGVNWNDYPAFFKRGTYIQRRIETNKFTQEEIESLPPKHEARLNPNLEFERSVVKQLALPPLHTINNRAEVIFFGEDPLPVTPKHIKEALSEIIKEEAIESWLDRLNPAFGENICPRALIGTDREQEILDMVGRIIHGVYS